MSPFERLYSPYLQPLRYDKRSFETAGPLPPLQLKRARVWLELLDKGGSKTIVVVWRNPQNYTIAFEKGPPSVHSSIAE